MADQYGINLASALQNAETIKSNRMKNEVAGMNLATAKRLEAERPMREELVSGYQTAAIAGNDIAKRKLLKLDPEGAPQFLKGLETLDGQQREKVKAHIEEMGTMAANVLQSKTTEEAQARYTEWRDSVSPEQKQRMPEVYSQDLTELALAKAMTMDQAMETPKAVTVGNQNVLYRHGQEIERKNIPAKAGAGGAGAGGFKTGDESLAYRQVMGFFEPMKDPITGELKVLANDAEAVQNITARAVQLMREGVATSEAVRVAYSEHKGRAKNNSPTEPTPKPISTEVDIRQFITK